MCRPQVPFAHGGAEIFSDTLVEQLRARGHEAEIVSVPFKWYPGARVLTQAFLWRLLDLTETDGRPIDMVVATKFPSYAVRHPEKRVWLVHQFRQAYELDRTELGQFGESAEDRAVRRQVQELDRVALGEATRLFATSSNVAGRLERSTGLVAEVLPHPAAGARLPRRRPGGLRPLGRAGSTARSGSTCWSRPPRTSRRSRSSSPATGRTARGSSSSSASEGSTGGCASPAGSRRTSSPISTRRAAATFYAPVDEDFGMGPYESFLVRQARDHGDRRGRPARGRARRLDRARRRARRRSGRRGGRLAARPPGRGGGLRPGGQRHRRRGHLGPRDRQAALVKVAVFSPMPPERSGIADYSALLLPALRARCEIVTVKRGSKRPPRGTDLARLPRRQQPGGPRLDRRRAAPRRRASSSSTTSSSTTSSRASRSPAATGDGYLDALERDGGLVGAAARRTP